MAYMVVAGRYDVLEDGTLEANTKFVDFYDTIREAKDVARTMQGYDFVDIQLTKE